MNIGKGLAAVSALGWMLSLGGTGLAQENLVGAEAFRTSCAVCHGADGKGDGEFAAMLTIKPSDLTVLKQNNSDKVFPYFDVFRTIDGRTELPAHGSRLMPIWGNYFAGRPDVMAAQPFGAELLIRARIVALVDYIESIQVE